MRRYSPYSFTLDNPLRYVDPDGMKVTDPGDLFNSMDAAAKDFAKLYNDNSIVNKAEYATTIYQVRTSGGKTYYSFSEPNQGDETGSYASGTGWTRKDVGYAHTHGGYAPGINFFSLGDIDYSDDYRLVGYVATPDGSLKKYDPVAGVSLVSTDIPSDPNDPGRLNTIDPIGLPKNEPTRTFGNFLRDNFLVPLSGVFRNSGPIMARLVF